MIRFHIRNNAAHHWNIFAEPAAKDAAPIATFVTYTEALDYAIDLAKHRVGDVHVVLEFPRPRQYRTSDEVRFGCRMGVKS